MAEGQRTNEKFHPKSIGQKVVRGALIAIETEGCSQRSRKQPLCPVESWRGDEVWLGGTVLETDVWFKKQKTEPRTLSPSNHKRTTWRQAASRWCGGANVAVLSITTCHCCPLPDFTLGTIYHVCVCVTSFAHHPCCWRNRTWFLSVVEGSPLFIHFLVDEHLDWFQFWTIINETIVLFVARCFHFSWVNS